MKVVVGMIVGCSLLGSIQPYLWAYNPQTDRCSLRPHAEALWEVWSWSTEMIVFLVVPLVILIVNILVMKEVWRMSKSGPAAGGPVQPAAAAKQSTPCHSSVLSRRPRHSSVHSGGTQKNAATNAMLLTVSFYVIFTTLPATLVYVLANVFPEVRPSYHGMCGYDAALTTGLTTPTGGVEDHEMVSWRRYVVYATVRNVTNEICLSHYACNFFFYVVTGKEFRSALRRLCGRSVTEIKRGSENGALRCGRGSAERAHAAGNEQRTLLARI